MKIFITLYKLVQIGFVAKRSMLFWYVKAKFWHVVSEMSLLQEH